jgi:aryl-alcohol dehydrogenase-like predicted oxidoreductase
MEQRRLGKSDVIVSVVGLGCNNFGGRLGLKETRGVLDAALAAGITHLDTADVYGSFGTRLKRKLGDSERFIGEVLKGRRQRAVIATKFGSDMGDKETARGAPPYVRRAVEASLHRLGTDYIDIVYYHQPDDATPLSETVEAMRDLVGEGKARAIACSNLSAQQLREIGPQIDALQNSYSLLNRADESEIIPLCLELGVAYIPYFPLANGLLTGKHSRGAISAGTRLEGASIEDAVFERVLMLDRFAREHGRSLLELAIAGLASRPPIASVIAGAMTPEQVRANAAAAGWALSEDDRAALAAI